MNFDKNINRIGTGSVKWDLLEDTFGDKDILPMWVADMDFQNAEPIRLALHRLIEEEILGYSIPSEKLIQSIISWQSRRHKMDLNPEDIMFSPGVLGSISVCVKAFSNVGESVMIHDPVYPPFTNLVHANKRKLVRSPLLEQEEKYVMDFVDIEKKMKENKVKVFILSNPQNPGGRVWSEEELKQLADLCVKNNVILLSDEIHGDLVFKENTFHSTVTLDESYKDWIITLHSATKTFNIAGVKFSFLFVFNSTLREKISQVQDETVQATLNTFGLVATETAFAESEEWLEELMVYLDRNRQLVIDFFDSELSEVKYMVPEATYLFWFDATSCPAPNNQLKETFVKVGKIGLNEGESYGPSGDGWMRFNFAAPRSMVEDGLQRIKKVFNQETE